jgi:hypothetical protein
MALQSAHILLILVINVHHQYDIWQFKKKKKLYFFPTYPKCPKLRKRYIFSYPIHPHYLSKFLLLYSIFIFVQICR